jgi:hypothetical protein
MAFQRLFRHFRLTKFIFISRTKHFPIFATLFYKAGDNLAQKPVSLPMRSQFANSVQEIQSILAIPNNQISKNY